MNNKTSEASPPLRNPQLEMMEMETERLRDKPSTNRDWLNSLSTVELVDWIKNTASAMSDAELQRWMRRKNMDKKLGSIGESCGGVPCGYPGESGILGMAMALKSAADARVIEFTRAGVVQLPGYDLSFAVNGESIEEYIRSEVEKRRPAKDHYGNFVAKVTVRLEFLGDMEAE